MYYDVYMKTIGMKTLLLLAALLSGCAPELQDPPAIVTESTPTQSPALVDSPFLPTFTESTPVVYGGRPLVVSFSRDTGAQQIDVRELNGSLISSTPWINNLGCAIVEGSRLYSFATGPNEVRTEISMSYTESA